MIMLNEETIAHVLSEVVDDLLGGDLYQAGYKLEQLGFWRFLKPIESSTKGPIRFIDPAQGFGSVRVVKTAARIEECIVAINAGEIKLALQKAEESVECWKLPKE